MALTRILELNINHLHFMYPFQALFRVDIFFISHCGTSDLFISPGQAESFQSSNIVQA